ncbi:SAM hydrolase/SAM-dependent halogenase family protein [Thiocapsa sp. UBA6158]|jgi:S-adenosylmethionine hydrolase|uniref:SAM hydrolase/SAM-dependent halogenase family protein n=1 Tax=Thiocapsa sp. UBA6158 TaxID=1947692 RepID=UPI0025F05548|nr:SAM-dependent chlorinase/fluorinase [Thiocapsa sp. UBA6158]
MSPIRRLVLVTDFGDGIYVGQMRARLGDLLPGVPLVDLVHDLPPFRIDLAACLLPALVRDMPAGSIYVCVVDPGVGGARAGLLVQMRDSWFIGPDNGLLVPLVHCAEDAVVARIGWYPSVLSASFHGRDWFAPAAARLALGTDLQLCPLDPADMVGSDWPKERAAVVYVDRFGNLMTGLQATGRPRTHALQVGQRCLRHARTFCEVASGEAFWYENAFGLVEIAVNLGRADRELGLSPGDPIGPFLPLG